MSKSLTNSFKNQLVDCNTVVVQTSGHTILHEAIVLDRREHFKLCEVYGADWDKADLNGVTPLMKAVALNRIYYVQKLIKLGADQTLRDNRGMSAADYGQFYQSVDSLDILLNEDNV